MAPKPRQQKNLYGCKTILTLRFIFKNKSIILNNINFSKKGRNTRPDWTIRFRKTSIQDA